MNSELTMTLPPYQIACGATDILAHIMERYFTNEPDVDLTDRLCEGTMQAVIRAARVMVQDPHDYDAASQLMWASTIAHNDTLSVGRVKDFASHQIEHELSALYDCAHGAGLAVVTPAWMEYVYRNDISRFAQFAVRVFGCEMNFANPEATALEGIRRLREFFRSLGMPTSLVELGCGLQTEEELGIPVTFAEIGAKAEDIPDMVAHRAQKPNGFPFGNFVKIQPDDMAEICRLCCR